jgi:hypothetical protein
MEGILDVISQLEKSERIVDIWCNVRFAHDSTHTICDHAGKFTESAKSGPKVFV